MDQRLAGLLRLLELERVEVNIFRGGTSDEKRLRVFGGQVAGQALVATHGPSGPASLDQVLEYGSPTTGEILRHRCPVPLVRYNVISTTSVGMLSSGSVRAWIS